MPKTRATTDRALARRVVEGREAVTSATLVELLRGLLDEVEQAPVVDGVEWGAKWSDGGYCPAETENYARWHARTVGTRVIRRDVGAWVYDDTGELVPEGDVNENGRWGAAPQPEPSPLCRAVDDKTGHWCNRDRGHRDDHWNENATDILASWPQETDQ
jgi:hypothetical protein